jgi:hypothetical protein
VIESPSAEGYLRISVGVSLATFAALGAWLLIVIFSAGPTPSHVRMVACDAEVSVNTSGWIEIPAGGEFMLRMPPDMRPVKGASAGDAAAYWRATGGSLAVSILPTLRSQPRWRSVPQFEGPEGGRATAGCPRATVAGHPAHVEATYWERDGGGGYFRVYAQVQISADSVLRINVTSSDSGAPEVGLAIVRSLRFVTGPPPT